MILIQVDHNPLKSTTRQGGSCCVQVRFYVRDVIKGVENQINQGSTRGSNIRLLLYVTNLLQCTSEDGHYINVNSFSRPL